MVCIYSAPMFYLAIFLFAHPMRAHIHTGHWRQASAYLDRLRPFIAEFIAFIAARSGEISWASGMDFQLYLPRFDGARIQCRHSMNSAPIMFHRVRCFDLLVTCGFTWVQMRVHLHTAGHWRQDLCLSWPFEAFYSRVCEEPTHTIPAPRWSSSLPSSCSWSRSPSSCSPWCPPPTPPTQQQQHRTLVQ